MKENKFLKFFGTILMIIGAMVILSAFPLMPLSSVSIGPITFSDINQISTTRMALGTVIFFLGLLAFTKR